MPDGAGPDMDRAALESEWLHLTRVVLPGLTGARGWPIRADHCFQRVLLDVAVGGVWYDAVAERLETEVIGRNVVHGRRTFQIVEDFDDNYWSAFREHERRVRDELQRGVRHVFEAEMKERRRSHGKPGHERRPQ